ncbi:MAG: hypothetical protein WCH43_11155 [Verrucomicrobiota bacterium]
MKKLFFLIVVAAAVWAYFNLLAPIKYPSGILIPTEPDQLMVSKAIDPVHKGPFTLRLVAEYTIDARVLHLKRYWSGEIAKFAPYDLAVGWGPMSDQSVLDRLTITQGNRFFFWEYEGQSPIPEKEIISHSANMHLIPASFFVRNQIAWLRRGELVRLKGYLVEVTAPGMIPWRSSMSRSDTGNGACEIMWVQSVEKLKPVEEKPVAGEKR